MISFEITIFFSKWALLVVYPSNTRLINAKSIQLTVPKFSKFTHELGTMTALKSQLDCQSGLHDKFQASHGFIVTFLTSATSNSSSCGKVPSFRMESIQSYAS